ncbi:thymidylate synthase [Pseudoalteromonas marina]|uniref:Thymidylate synthase n=1 Tax=Pseudoalteromonas marina TaxID=267375 RepID=A0ABT9FGC1_9GAMM|nr:thymidylate synthase [Pseudoalteromonas marina]MDP2565831.1 thymidylate synthase [Pseudoalteromonas marina]
MENKPENQYLNLCRRIIDEGTWVNNKRTGERCLTVINADLEYNVAGNEFPLCTTRKSYYKSAISELLGYLRGYDSAAQFRAIGCKTWDANANENEAWLANKYRKGEDDLGRIYGVQGREFVNQAGEKFDQLKQVYDDIRDRNDHRGLIVTFHNPGEIHMGCLRACMHTHSFSILGDTLYLTSYQRSADTPLGLNYNQIQVFTLLSLMAQITGLKCGKAYHKIVNAHIYAGQLHKMKNIQLKREPFSAPKLRINPEIKTLEDVETWVTADDFIVEGYEHHDPIAYPFSV